MKKFIIFFAALSLVIAMLVSSVVIVSAEVTEQKSEADNETSFVTITDEGGRAYELVWKFVIIGEHLYKRRWNMTLGEWYDPEWILVY